MEQITKRVKNSLIQGAVANILLLWFFMVLLFFSITPRLEGISQQKEELITTYEQLNTLKKKGISFWEFKKIVSSSGGNDEFLQVLVQELDGDFYNRHFVNLWDEDYESFISTLRERVETTKLSTEYTRSQDLQQKLLPFYDQNNVFSQEGLSDFDFVNYVEFERA